MNNCPNPACNYDYYCRKRQDIVGFIPPCKRTPDYANQLIRNSMKEGEAE